MRDRENLNCPAKNRLKIRHNDLNSCDSGLNWENNSIQENFSDLTIIDGIEDDTVDSRDPLPKLYDFKYTEKKLNLNEKNVLMSDEDNNQELTQNKSSRTTKLETRIYNLAIERDISLRLFKNLAQRMSITKIEKTIIKAACLVLLDTIKTYELPRFVKNKRHLQQMLDGKFFLIKGDPGFENLADQENVKYGGIIYIIRPIRTFCIFPGIIEEIYIGVTWKTLIDRFIAHTEDAINSYIEEDDWPNRLIEHLILGAMEDYLSNKYSCNSEISLVKQFIESEILEKEKWEKSRIIKNIAENLYHTYFQMEILEVHRNYETAWYRERWYIENYPRKLNGKLVRGTLSPNGLNMVISPEKPGHRTLPLYDIIFLVCLGFIGPEINEMIRVHYLIDINFRTVYSHLNKFWKNWDNILKLFFKPVLQVLLEDEEYQWKDIAKSLHRAPSYRTKKNFKEWFHGLNVTQLRYTMKRENFDWNNLEEIAKEFKADLSDQNTVKGIPVDTWIEWFITDIGMEEITKILGYKNVVSFRSAWLKQGRISIFQKKFGATYTLAVKKYRKKRAIELLTDEDFIDTALDSRLYWIYLNEFGFKSWENYAVDRPSQGLRNCSNFFENLFKEEGLTADDLENLTASNYMENQKIYNIIE